MLKSYLKRRQPTPTQEKPWSIPDLCAAYNWPTNLPGGGVIAIVELGGGWLQSDVDKAFQEMGLPAPKITDVSVDSTTNSPGSDADGEVALDIQVAAAAYTIATGEAATVRMYWSQDIGSAVMQAAKDGCHVCSISWGAPEEVWGSAAVMSMESIAEAATAAGMTIFAASGDNDSDDGDRSPSVDCPSCCPAIVGCGGTMKPVTGTEAVWNNEPGHANGNGTGGGYSAIFPSQSWQVGIKTAPVGLGRMVPDVAAAADPATGYEIWLDGQLQVFGGTSCVAPLYSGLFAGFGKPLGFVTATLYKNPGWFNDIVKGNNGTYTSSVGPDPCTGLGSPIADKIVF